MSFLTYRVHLNEAVKRKFPADDLFSMTRNAIVRPAVKNSQFERLLTAPMAKNNEPNCLQTFSAKFFYTQQKDVEQKLLGHPSSCTFQTYAPPYPPNESNWILCKHETGFVIYTSMEDSNGGHWRADTTGNIKKVHLESNSTELDDRDIFKFSDGLISPLTDDYVVVKYDPTNLSSVDCLPLTDDLNDPNIRFNIVLETLEFTVMK